MRASTFLLRVVAVCFLLFTLLVRHRPRRPPSQHWTYDSNWSCDSHFWLVGSSSSPSSLRDFLLQFPRSTLPSDLCVCFTTPTTDAYVSFLRVRNLLLLPPAHLSELPLESARYSARNAAYLLAISYGARRILDADDDTFFYTVHYGVGKGDVSANHARSISTLLNRNVSSLLVRSLRSHPARPVVDPAQVILDRSYFPRGMPLQFLIKNTRVRPSSIYERLPNLPVNSSSGFVLRYLSNVHSDSEFLFASLYDQLHQLASDVRDPDATYEPHVYNRSLRAVAFERGTFAPVNAKNTLYERNAFWGLVKLRGNAPLYSDVISGFVMQRVLWSLGKRMLFAAPAMDVWQTPQHVPNIADNVLQNELLTKAVELLSELELEGSPRRARVQYLLAMMPLVEHGVLSRRDVSIAKAFFSDLQALQYKFPWSMRGKRTWRMSSLLNEVPSTAVCVTGQMRSAPFAASNARRRLLQGLGSSETFIITEADDRAGAARLFNPIKVVFSERPDYHDVWIKRLVNASVLHPTMATRQHLSNYLRQLYDMRVCLTLVQSRERERGRKFEHIIRMRPDTMFSSQLDRSLWEGKGYVVGGLRQSFYALNDRFFAGERRLMERLLSCHDIFWDLLGSAEVFHRQAGDRTHMMFKKLINSERYLARCAAVKRVPLHATYDIDARRVAYSGGVAAWREWEPE